MEWGVGSGTADAVSGIGNWQYQSPTNNPSAATPHPQTPLPTNNPSAATAHFQDRYIKQQPQSTHIQRFDCHESLT